MTVPSEVNCPICNNKMINLNKENPVLDVSSLSLVVNGKKKSSKTVLFLCEKCDAAQTFLVLSDETNS